MSFTLGRDLGIVMAKGVLLGVLSCVTVLPSLILLLDKPLQKTRHRSILPKMDGLAKGVTKVFPVFLALFVVLAPVFYFAYDKTNDEVYYDMGQCLPEDMEYVIANSKLSEEFDIASTHMLLVDASLPSKQVRSMISDMEQVDGVKYVLGLESVVGAACRRRSCRIPSALFSRATNGSCCSSTPSTSRERRSECPDRFAQCHSEEI